MRPWLPLLVALALTGASVPSAFGSTPFRRCRETAGAECARVDVPLDRSGHVAGTIGLHVERLRARTNATGAVIALAGGPGEAATPSLRDFATVIRPALGSRDLIAFDQRGTGRSGLLRCPSLERAAIGNLGRAVQACAAALGPKRAFYATQDSADDIEAVRRALGVDKIVLYGTSYGTKLALAYAALYPAHVERLVLDSVLPLDGPDPFARTSFGAVPRVLGSLCAKGACRAITADPVADLAELVARLGRSPLRGHVIGVDGRPRARRLGRVSLSDILFGGDFDPSLRAELPAAVESALRGDPAPLLRLSHRAAISGGGPEAPEDFSDALALATSCEDGPFPWRPSASFSDRWGQAISRAAALPDSAFYPFDRATARADYGMRLCAHWPASGRNLVSPGALPNVPTLLVSGGDDLRTPKEDAARVAAQIPDSRLVVLPAVGHSALGSDLSGCGFDAVKRFFAAQPVAPTCPPGQRFVQRLVRLLSLPTPIPPPSVKDLPPVRGVSGRPGRTLSALAITIFDASLQELYAGLNDYPRRPIGGLRAGRLTVGGRFERYSYIPGVEVSGPSLLNPPRVMRFRIGGRAASRGVLVLDRNRHRLTGRLGARRIRIRSQLTPAAAPRTSGAHRGRYQIPFSAGDPYKRLTDEHRGPTLRIGKPHRAESLAGTER